MELDDVEDALEHPPQQLQDMFEGNNAQKTESKNDGTFKVPGADDDATVETADEMPQMPNLGGLGDMLKNVDIDSMMKNMDLGAIGNMMKGRGFRYFDKFLDI